MNKKPNQRITLTRRLLKESLLELMEEKNINKISVKELCEASGINRSTFYNHYSCPADILEEIERTVIKEMEEIWENEFSKGDWPMNKRIETLCDYVIKNKDMFRLLMRDADTSSGFPAMLMESAHVHFEDENLFMRSSDEESNQLMTVFLTNGSYSMIRKWILDGFKKTPEEMGEMVNMMARHGWEKVGSKRHN